jgi:hypothetical protein
VEGRALLPPTARAVSRVRRPGSVVPVLLALISVTAQMLALGAASGWVAGPTLASQPKPRMAAALIAGFTCSSQSAHKAAACPAVQPQPASSAAGAMAERVVVPDGAKPCPESGPGAACRNRKPVAESGSSAVPDGWPVCPTDPTKPTPAAPGSCDPADSESTGNGSTPSTGPQSPVADPAAQGSTASPAPGNPPLQAGSEPNNPQRLSDAVKVVLTSNQSFLAYGSTAVLEARSSVSVSGTPWAIEIFDRTSSALVGACAQSSHCRVAYTGKTGVHEFTAYLTTPTQSVPTVGPEAMSNTVAVRWVGVGLVVNDPMVVAPGRPITFTAFASEDVSSLGYRVELRDATSGRLLTYCSQGAICSTSLVEPTSGVRAVFATMEPKSPALHQGAADVRATSGNVYGTWLGVHLDATTTMAGPGGVVWLAATANTDLSSTPWSIYIFRQDGVQIGQPCNATTCSASVTVGAGDDSQYRAVIARDVTAALGPAPIADALAKVRATGSRLSVQVSSPLVKPVRILWGVDSCQASTIDPAGNSGMYAQVVSAYGGAPDFWGRYLTTTYNCPGLSPAEISSAHAHHMGILPIYDDYDCSALQGIRSSSSRAGDRGRDSSGRGHRARHRTARKRLPGRGRCRPRLSPGLARRDHPSPLPSDLLRGRNARQPLPTRVVHPRRRAAGFRLGHLHLVLRALAPWLLLQGERPWLQPQLHLLRRVPVRLAVRAERRLHPERRHRRGAIATSDLVSVGSRPPAYCRPGLEVERQGRASPNYERAPSRSQAGADREHARGVADLLDVAELRPDRAGGDRTKVALSGRLKPAQRDQHACAPGPHHRQPVCPGRAARAAASWARPGRMPCTPPRAARSAPVAGPTARSSKWCRKPKPAPRTRGRQPPRST